MCAIANYSVHPSHRMRRLRATNTLRRMVRETDLSVDDFIYPLFVMHGDERRPILSMPGCDQIGLEVLGPEIEEIVELGIPAVILFGLPEEKDELASEAYASDGVVQLAMRTIKELAPELVVVGDVCLCEYTSHGHCGVVVGGEVQNDATLEILARTAVAQAQAGADIVAPSDMMDGRVAAIRTALDEAGFQGTPILAYSAKYASAFYGPFREAADSTPQFGDRRSYQMDPPNAREALRAIERDIAEGADMVMVKPALAYLDVIAKAREITHLPLVAYNVSGEYAMLKAAAANGWIDERRCAMEVLTGIRRAGADLILSYYAKDVARWLREEQG
ncbi:MAG: porphobilinogen synthase [Bacteroidetes bacterium]|nr:porphobilinogen synthase [Bacteroidota bacterium]MCL5025130.1 porphobilinogen synthase [Chloroflexota bacterium]